MAKKMMLMVLLLVSSSFLMGGQAVPLPMVCTEAADEACRQTEEIKQTVSFQPHFFEPEDTPETLRFEKENYTVMTKEEKELRKQKEILVRIVEAEAGDQDLRGRRLVANVVINRVKSKEFPNTIREVVFAKRQFSPIANGSYARVKVSKKTRKAVEQALSGRDDSHGALYFMWREGSSERNVSWFDRDLTRLFRYGCHEFFR